MKCMPLPHVAYFGQRMHDHEVYLGAVARLVKAR